MIHYNEQQIPRTAILMNTNSEFYLNTEFIQPKIVAIGMVVPTVRKVQKLSVFFSLFPGRYDPELPRCRCDSDRFLISCDAIVNYTRTSTAGVSILSNNFRNSESVRAIGELNLLS